MWWGAARLEAKPWYMNGLKLRYLLADLESFGGRVLDVGCGAGSVAKAVKRARPDLEVHGCDMSKSALATALSPSPQGVDFRVATAERLPFGDAELDFVWIFDVLEHVESPEAVLREVARVVRPGGGFHIVLPLEGQPRALTGSSDVAFGGLPRCGTAATSRFSQPSASRRWRPTAACR